MDLVVWVAVDFV